MEDKFIHYRIFGYVVTLGLHIGSLMDIVKNGEEKLAAHPELKFLYQMQFRYLTIWNVVFQVTYAIVGLSHDICTLMKKESLIPETIKKYRYTFFNAIVFPYTMLVSVTFWSIFLYDRELVFPKLADIIVSKMSNHVIHTFIVPIAVWEAIYQPRQDAVSHMDNCKYILLMYFGYNSVLFYSRYGDLGYWAYDIITVIEGSIYFYIFFANVLVTLYISYFGQWYIKYRIWQHRILQSKVNIDKK